MISVSVSNLVSSGPTQDLNSGNRCLRTIVSVFLISRNHEYGEPLLFATLGVFAVLATLGVFAVLALRHLPEPVKKSRVHHFSGILGIRRCIQIYHRPIGQLGYLLCIV